MDNEALAISLGSTQDNWQWLKKTSNCTTSFKTKYNIMFIYLGTHPVQNTHSKKLTILKISWPQLYLFPYCLLYNLYVQTNTNTAINFCAFSDLFCCFFCSGWVQRRRCPSHTQESLRFFCLVCEELTCKDCQLITHKGHRYNSNQPSQISACED